MPLLGEICALLTALCFTASSTAFAYSSRAVGGIATNQFRLFAAVPVLAALVVATTGTVWPAGLEGPRLWLVVGSGLAGLVLGDAGYFHALATIGPRLSSVVMATWPAMALGMALCTGEWPTGRQLAGIGLLLLGVVLVLLRSRDGAAWNGTLSRAAFWRGVAGALLGAFGQALGVVLAKAGMAPGPSGEPGADPLVVTFVRMLAGAVGLQGVALVQRRPLAFLQVPKRRDALVGASVGMLFGPVLGVWLSMLATRHVAATGVAAALMATMPVFMLPVAALVYRAPIGGFGIAGTLLATGGAAVLLLGGA